MTTQQTFMANAVKIADDLGHSQADLAIASGLTKSAFSRRKSGEIDLSFDESLAIQKALAGWLELPGHYIDLYNLEKIADLINFQRAKGGPPIAFESYLKCIDHEYLVASDEWIFSRYPTLRLLNHELLNTYTQCFVSHSGNQFLRMGRTLRDMFDTMHEKRKLVNVCVKEDLEALLAKVSSLSRKLWVKDVLCKMKAHRYLLLAVPQQLVPAELNGLSTLAVVNTHQAIFRNLNQSLTISNDANVLRISEKAVKELFATCLDVFRSEQDQVSLACTRFETQFPV